MRRSVFLVLGGALLSIGGIGIVVGLAWLTASHVNGTLPYILDERESALLYFLPALLLMISALGAAFIGAALAAPPKEERAARHLRLHTHFHV